MATRPAELLRDWLSKRLAPAAVDWLEDRLERVLDGEDRERQLDLAVSMVPRKLGTAPLAADPAERAAAEDSRPGWRLDGWLLSDAARVLLILQASAEDGARCAADLARLFRTADLGEQVGLYRGLPLYPDPERHVARATEGLRSNMQDVFEAVALENPYPAEQLPEGAWNQMVLKALFIGSRLAPIQRLEERANEELSRMLCDYARERRAAGRRISPELWRCVALRPIAGAAELLAEALASQDEQERLGAALACLRSPHAEIRSLLEGHPELARAAEDANWPAIARAAPG